MGKSAKTPAIPDPARTLEKAAELNRIDQFGPFGDITFADDGGSMTKTLSPELLNLFSGAVNVAGMPAPDVTYGGVTPRVNTSMGASFTPRNMNEEYAQASYDAAKTMLDPVYERQAGRLSQDLANKGLPVAGEAYKGAWDDFNRAEGQAYQRAAFDAIRGGLAAGQTQQQLDQGQRQSQFNMMAALLGLQPTASISPLDVQGSYNAAQQQANLNANAQNQAKQNMFSNLGAIAALI